MEKKRALAESLYAAVYPALDEDTQELVDLDVADHDWDAVTQGLSYAARVLGLDHSEEAVNGLAA